MSAPAGDPLFDRQRLLELTKALQLAVRMGRGELENDGHVSEGCWELCDALHVAQIAQLPNDRDEPGRRG